MAAVELVSDTERLQVVVKELQEEPYVCVDTEFMREDTFFPTLCLIQLRGGQRESVAYCVDTLAIPPQDIKDILLIPLFYQSDVLKVFHSCSQDLEVLHYASGFPDQVISPLFDTSIGWRYLSTNGGVSYQNLVHQLLQITLDQSQTRSNWEQRPLTSKQLTYAANDVIYLVKVFEKMRCKLQERERWEASLLECNEEILRGCKKPDISRGISYVKKKGNCNTALRKEKLYYTAAWRDELAMKYNCPRRWALTDDQVVRIALQLAYLEEKKKELFVYFENFHYHSPIRELSDTLLSNELKEFMETNNLPSQRSDEKPQVSKEEKMPYSVEFWKERDVLKREISEKIKEIADREEIYSGCFCNFKQLGAYLDGDNTAVSEFSLKYIKKVLEEGRCQYVQLVERFQEKARTTPQIPKPKGISKKKTK